MVSEKKLKAAEEIKELLNRYSSFLVADYFQIPASLFQKIRKNFRDRAEIKVVKRRVLEKVLDELGMKELKELLPLRTALIFTQESVIKLKEEIENIREKLPVKAGAVAPADIVVPAGPTGIPPGPAIGEFQAAGIPAKIDKGQIAVIKDTTVAKAGEEIRPEVALILNKLGISPFEASLKITLAYSNGIIFTEEALAITPSRVKDLVSKLQEDAVKLCFAIEWPIPEVVRHLMTKAATEALNLAVNAGWPTKESVKYLLAKAHAHALKLKEVV